MPEMRASRGRATALSGSRTRIYIYIPIGIYGGQTKKGQRRKSRYHKSAYMVCASVCAYTSERARGKGHGTSERVHKRGRGERERKRRVRGGQGGRDSLLWIPGVTPCWPGANISAHLSLSPSHSAIMPLLSLSLVHAGGYISSGRGPCGPGKEREGDCTSRGARTYVYVGTRLQLRPEERGTCYVSVYLHTGLARRRRRNERDMR